MRTVRNWKRFSLSVRITATRSFGPVPASEDITSAIPMERMTNTLNTTVTQPHRNTCKVRNTRGKNGKCIRPQITD